MYLFHHVIIQYVEPCCACIMWVSTFCIICGLTLHQQNQESTSFTLRRRSGEAVVRQILFSFSGSVTLGEENQTVVCFKDFIYKPKSCLQSPAAPTPQGLYRNTSIGSAVIGDAYVSSAVMGILPHVSQSSWMTLLSMGRLEHQQANRIKESRAVTQETQSFGLSRSIYPCKAATNNW